MMPETGSVTEHPSETAALHSGTGAPANGGTGIKRFAGDES